MAIKPDSGQQNQTANQTQLTVAAAYSQAVNHFNQQNYAQAEQLCHAILQALASHIEAINLLGVIAQKVNRHDLAVAQFMRAISIDSSHATIYYNLGISLDQLGKKSEAVTALQTALERDPGNRQIFEYLQAVSPTPPANRQAIANRQDRAKILFKQGIQLQQSGQIPGAIAHYQEVLTIQPQNCAALCNMGVALQAQGKLTEAIECFQTALEFQPGHAQTHNNLGNALRDQGSDAGAITSYKKAITCQPDYAEAHNNLGNLLATQGKGDLAIASYKKAIAIKPDYAEAYSNLGNILRDQGELARAIINFKHSLKIDPDISETHNNLGNALRDQGAVAAAIDSYRKAIALTANYASSHNNLGIALQDQGKLGESATHLQKAIAIKPDYPEAHNNLGNVLTDQGRFNEAITSYDTALKIKPDYAEANSNLLLVLHYGNHTLQHIFNQHKKWYANQVKHLSTTMFNHQNQKGDNPDKKLRIGFVSGDFRKHSVSYFLQELFIFHNRENFTFFCYSNSHQIDAVSKLLQESVEGWQKIAGKDDQTVLEMIQGDEIDILVDLSGHTKNNRLTVFARKPAPIQVTYLGYPDSTGLATMDYRITDPIADPPGISDQYSSEKLLRLPRCFLCYTPPENAPNIATLPMQTNGYVTFVSFNNLAKISAEVIVVWARILNAVPGSKLIIKNNSLACAAVKRDYLELFANESIAADRLLLLPRTDKTEEHLATYNRADIGLDPFPYHGTTTTCEALWMGVPVVVLRGDRHVSRVGVSLLSCTGLAELICNDVDAYVELAVALAQDSAKLAKLRSGMRSRIEKSPLCDSRGFAHEMEQAFYGMWQEWCSKPKTQGWQPKNKPPKQEVKPLR